MSKNTKVVPVTQYLAGKAVAKYPSIAIASRFTKTQPAHIGKVANGKRNLAGGFSWKSNKTFGTRFSPKNAGIAQLDKTGTIMALYESAEMASTLSGVTLKGINKVVTGNGNIAGGFRWASCGDIKSSTETI